MSKYRSFTLIGYWPFKSPSRVDARSLPQLVRRLAEALNCEQSILDDSAEALWNDQPVFLADLSTAIIPGVFGRISYQNLGIGR